MSRFGFTNFNRNENRNHRQTKARRLALENLEDRMLLAVTAGGEDAAAEAALISAAQPTGSVIEITTLSRTAINDAITAAADGDTIRFADSLAGQTLTLTRKCSDITKSITIDGNGVTLSGGSSSSAYVFNITAGIVSIQNLNFDQFGNSAIAINNADLSVTNCIFTNNYSAHSETIPYLNDYNYTIGGGAISGWDVNLTVDGCTFTGNSAKQNGGAIAIYNEDPNTFMVTSVTNSTFTDNFCDESHGRGGAISIITGTLNIAGSEFTGNHANAERSQGGAVYLEGATAFIDNSAFTWNQAIRTGSNDAYGGAIYANVGSNLYLSNSLVANNRSNGDGAGIMVASGVFNARNCTIAFNCSTNTTANVWAGGSTAVYNTIIANARANNGAEGNLNNTNIADANMFNCKLSMDNGSTSEMGFTSVYIYDWIGDRNYTYGSWDDAACDWRNKDWNYSLVKDSVCRNAGVDDNALASDGLTRIATDLAENERFVSTVDIGAYEVQRGETDLDDPTNVAATADTTEISVTWDAVENASSYTLRYCADGEDWTEVTGLTETSYTITGLISRTDYTIGVKAVGDGVAYTDSSYTMLEIQTLTAETYVTVTNLNDSGEGSLRAAIDVAGTDAYYYITFADGLSGTISLNSAIGYNAAKLINIDAAGITITAATGASAFHGFDISSDATGKLRGEFTISNAVLRGFGNAAAELSGNMIATFENCTIENNSLAGIRALNATMTLNINGCTVQNNTSSIAGGGLFVNYATANITDSVISGNSTSGEGGGGLYMDFNTATITGSTFIGNTAGGQGKGGGIYIYSTTLDLSDSSVVENTANGTGGAGGGLAVTTDSSLYCDGVLIAGNFVTRPSSNSPADANGGAIHSYISNLYFSNTVIAGNMATGYAGAILTLFGSMSMNNCTVAGNVSDSSAGGLYTYDTVFSGINNSIIAGNASNNTVESLDANFYGNTGAPACSWSLFGTNQTGAGGSVVKSNIALNAQVANFATPTYASVNSTSYQGWAFVPVEGASIVDAASNTDALSSRGVVLTSDFRGGDFVRIYNDTVDIGAYEYQLATPKPSFEVTIEGYTGSYDGAAHGVALSGLIEGDVVYYSADGTDYSTDALTYTNAGNYTVYVKVVREGYKDWTGSADVVLEKVQLTVTGTTVADKLYDGNTSATITLGTVAGVVAGETVAVTPAAAFPSAEIGEYEVTVSYVISGATAANYLVPAADVVSASILGEAVTKINVSVVFSAEAPTENETALLPESLETITIGSTVYAQVWVMTADGSANGIGGGYVDMTYAAANFTVGTYTASACFGDMATFADTSVEGLVSAFGGMAAMTQFYGASSWALLGTMTFTASAEGTVTVGTKTPSLAGEEIEAMNLVRQDGKVLSSEINYGSQAITVVNNAEPLAAPVNVAVTSAGANRKSVSWDAVENAVSYTVAYSVDQVSWTEVAAADTSLTVTGLTYGDQVTFKVKAIGDGTDYSDSEYSEAVAKYVCPMDIDSDGRIGPADRSALSAAWFTRSTSAAWDIRADIDGDNFVGPTDRNFLSLNWMKSATSTSLIYPEAKADAVFAEAEAEELDFAAASLDVDFDFFD